MYTVTKIRRQARFSCVIPFGVASISPQYNLAGWDTILENLCLYNGQVLGDILKSPLGRVLALNKAAVEKAKRQSKELARRNRRR